MQDHRKLDVWRDAQDVASAIFGATERLRGAGIGALRSQMRRSAMSIGANIAEGAGQATQLQFAHFLQTAIASANETESHLDFARRRHLLPYSIIDALIADVVRVRRRTIALRKRVIGPPEPTTRQENLTPQTQKPDTQN